jgi:cell division protein FtsB
LQGGEYSTRDLYVLRARNGNLEREVDSLRRRVDSLNRYLRLVKTDSATQERIAREEFGMVRGEKEILYRFGDTVRR